MASTIMESLFQRTLEDLVKGLRVQMIGESRYISNHLEEIRKEIKSTDPNTKTMALQKLTYINMLSGIDMDWAAFHVIEAMSMTKFAHKKIGYLAASQSFHDGTDVLLLITNQLRKDLSSNNEYEAGVALECLSCIATPDLAQELTPEVFSLLASGRPYVRTRATLVIFKIFTKYPDAVRVACKRLVEKLEDTDPKVMSAAVSVFCEMAMKDPASCIPLAPEFYRLLLESKDNWLRIKVVKIFGVLAPLEPRLSRKIAEPLCEVMRHTVAKSLLLECIRTVVVGLPDHAEALKLAVQKLKELLEEDDPNLKYLGLQAMALLMPAHPWAVAENKSIIIRGLNDEDHSIQLACLQLILGMVSESNVIDTVQILLQYAERSEVRFCNEVIGAILATCSRGLYELVPDFTWVKEVRPDLLAVARGILLDPTLLDCPSLHRVLSAVAWIAGEYVDFSHSPFELIEALLQPRTKLLPPAVQAVYLQSILKTINIDSGKESEANHYTEVEEDSFNRLLELIEINVGPMAEQVDVEVHERACNLLGVAKALSEVLCTPEKTQEPGQHSSHERALEIASFLRSVFGQELGPVSVFAQSRVPVPNGLVLVKNLDSLDGMFCDEEVREELILVELQTREWDVGPISAQKVSGDESKHGESASLLAQHRQRHGTYYLPVEKGVTMGNEYPPPQIAQSDAPSTSSASDDIMKLAEKSFSWTKSRQTKPRPVVVRLDDADEDMILSSKMKKGAKDNVISNAIKDVLVGSKGKNFISSLEKEAADSHHEHGKKNHHHREHYDRNGTQESKPDVLDNTDEAVRRIGRKKHGKHRHTNHGSPISNVDIESSGKQRQEDTRKHSGQRSRHRLRSPVTVSPQAEVIPDFLL
ncbi:hypothetical protein GOP47_0000389 [Adiantum capillus-veneris]|uniref:AP-3 complex subunit delta n=1 Tax=Adiantum capillus-veneris TaxID=13818 RepID=A0A9D4ZT14_ADICA|nr:hypothetical protein GOP47_0000389 [Adiantum capillus-veneris]